MVHQILLRIWNITFDHNGAQEREQNQPQVCAYDAETGIDAATNLSRQVSVSTKSAFCWIEMDEYHTHDH